MRVFFKNIYIGVGAVPAVLSKSTSSKQRYAGFNCDGRVGSPPENRARKCPLFTEMGDDVINTSTHQHGAEEVHESWDSDCSGSPDRVVCSARVRVR